MKSNTKRRIAFAIVFVMLLGTTVFAADKEFLSLEASSKKGTLTLTNYKEDIPELIGKKVDFISYDTLNPDHPYPHTQIIKNAVVVTDGTTIKLNIPEPMFVEIQVYKLEKKDGVYSYQYRSPVPMIGTIVKDGEYPTYKTGVTVSIDEAGDYYVKFVLASISEIYQDSGFIRVEEGSALPTPSPAPTPAPEKVTAVATNSQVMVNGKIVSFDAYNINNNNYFKLRDVAYAVNGSEKQFGVDYDAKLKAINLSSNSKYTVVGSELAKGDGTKKPGNLNKSPIQKDGKLVDLTAYNINGNNYFKLRDLGKAFDISVEWNGKENKIEINTAKSYVE